MGESRNFILFAVLSLGILIGYQSLYLGPKEAERQRYEQQQLEALGETIQPPTATDAGPAPTTTQQPAETAPVYEEAGRVEINTPELSGSISLRGARIDDLLLNNHRVSLEENSGNVRLLRPLNEADSYFVRFGWTAKDKDRDFVPGPATVWTATGGELTPSSPVTLSWTNADAVTFEIALTVDEQFMFNVAQTVRNASGEAIEVAPYGIINREGEPDTDGLYILHEGAIGVFNGELQEMTYSDLEDDGNFESSTTGGWMGITDKFWMTALIPDQNKTLPVTRMARRVSGPDVSYRIEYTENWQAVAADSTSLSESKLYAGAKIVGAIDDYAERYQIQLFDRAIDWGWFWFLTKPIFAIVHYLFELTGNFGVAILLMTVILKIGLFWFANKSYVSMAHMRRAQPKIKALQERHGDDRAKMQQEMMELYKKEKINPMAGCLPMIPQMFIFFALYKVLYVTIEMRHQPFFGWIKDLSVADPLTPVNLFGLLPFDPPGIIAVGILPIMMGVSMWAMQKLNPQQASMDPTQQKIMNMLPLIFTFVMAQFSAGLVLYWTWNNILSIGQQWVIMRREDARMDEAKA
ncbi:MAG: membrane protein insertase YidC [Kordiimonadaceae bacterium]|nr:membrane protein insertase YidC [Kordiimonadaceae bacterium]MBO6568804.1 membrane protein insertase YidC [Kordiimonadaceae bacterium]MBO6965221.1 membrane protein insertase YidC [Kordiimonadaceae bacterium]